MRLLLVTGKGGVGKTTLAAATAARCAAAGRKTLVVSTDPAHSLGDVLGVPVGPEPAEVDGAAGAVPGLSAAHVDARRLVDAAWAGLRTHLATVLAGAGVDEVAADELTVLPGVEELLALAEVHDLAADGPWDVVVVDCAPTAETLRLLALPDAVARYLERLFPAHRRTVHGLLAPAAAQRWRAAADALSRLAEKLERLRAALADPDVTSVRLVLTPERVVADETRRTETALALLGVRVDGLVVNRLVPEPATAERGEAAAWLRARRREQDAVLATLGPVTTVGHRAAEPVGLAALASIGDELRALDGLLDTSDASDARGSGPVADRRSAPPLLTVRRTRGEGRDLDSEYALRVAVPLPPRAALDVARVGDDLAVTVDGRRRVLALPSVLRRCVAVGATQDAGGVVVRFRPDPAVWLR